MSKKNENEVQVSADQLDDIPESADATVVSFVDVKKNVIERAVEAGYQKRVKRAEAKAIKKASAEPKAPKNWKRIGVGLGVGLGAIALGAVSVLTGGVQAAPDNGNWRKDDESSVEGSSAETETEPENEG